LPNYRLPTEAEWEFAALGLIGNLDPKSENINDRRIYPWDGHYVRQDEKELTGFVSALVAIFLNVSNCNIPFDLFAALQALSSTQRTMINFFDMLKNKKGLLQCNKPFSFTF
jgi:hypothetical protein